MPERKVIIGAATYGRIMGTVQRVEQTPTDLTGTPRTRHKVAGGVDVYPACIRGFDEDEGWHTGDVYAEGVPGNVWTKPWSSNWEDEFDIRPSEEGVPIRLLGQDETTLRLPGGVVVSVALVPWQVDGTVEAQWTVLYPFTGVQPWVQLTGPHPSRGDQAVFQGNVYPSGTGPESAVAEGVTVFIVGASTPWQDVWILADWPGVHRLRATPVYRTWTPDGEAARLELVYECDGWFLLT